MFLRKRRYRDLKKVGIGGFQAKTRTPSRKPKESETPGEGGEDKPAEGEPPDEDEHECVDVGRRDHLVDGAYLWEGSRRTL